MEYGYESLIDLFRDSIIRYNQLFLRNLSHGNDTGSISEEIRYQKVRNVICRRYRLFSFFALLHMVIYIIKVVLIFFYISVPYVYAVP